MTLRLAPRPLAVGSLRIPPHGLCPWGSTRTAAFLCLFVLLCCGALSAGTIDTAFLEQPWPKQTVRHFEVGRDEVTWRQRANRREGVFAGVRFLAPLDQQAVWDKTRDFSDIGRMTPGVTAVRFLEDTPTRQVIQLDVKVLWKTLQLTFEVEQEPPRAIRFRLVNELLGEYRGVCWLEDAPQGTIVELATWLKPSRPIPTGLLLFVERKTFLDGVRNFLEECKHYPQSSQ